MTTAPNGREEDVPFSATTAIDPTYSNGQHASERPAQKAGLRDLN
ncbi:hypothetical protein [Lacipirellula sp.]